MTPISIALAIVAVYLLTFWGRTYGAVVTAAGFLFYAWYEAKPADPAFFEMCLWVAVAVAIVFGVKPIRRVLVSRHLMKVARKAMPKMGDTERIALEAGTVWFDGDLFSGKPNFKKLLDTKFTKLTKEEKEFIEGPTEELCAMLDDWQIAQERDLPKPVWDFIKKHKFLGMVIPKEHGGLGFGALAHSEVISRISSRSITAGVTVMVPNSLGPGELLSHYGTDEQKKQYLPNLAIGKEIPCFALTEPHAGSDAAGMRSVGIVEEGTYKGKKTLGIRISFNKRYITLAPIATVMGLAFKMYDPQKLLGGEEEYGITCALIPTDHKGVKIGNRHDPMGVPFMNGPIQGEDVFIPIDWIIGGKEYAGQGWKMLMEQLSAGRGISLPSLSVSGTQLAARTIGAYGTVREQFGIAIGKMEGVREPAARIAAHAYFMDATRHLACAAVDAGEKPSVISAISKAYMTEGMRACVNDAMDIQGGAAICRGPKNIFARGYDAIPVGITVEGSNTLTRSMIIFGQGAIRCHKHMQNLVESLADNDVKKFDLALFGWMNDMAKHKVRSFFYGVTGGAFITPPQGLPKKGKKYANDYKRLTHFSTNFAFLADVALLSLGGGLKAKQHLSGRYADALSWMLICSATLKRHHDNGYPKEHEPLVRWTLEHGYKEIEDAFDGITRNFPNRAIGAASTMIMCRLWNKSEGPNDKLTAKVASALFNEDDKVREAITQTVFVPSANDPSLGMLEAAYKAIIDAADVRKKIERARRKGTIEKSAVLVMAKQALDAKVITKAEYNKIEKAETLRDQAVQVDNFEPKAYKGMR